MNLKPLSTLVIYTIKKQERNTAPLDMLVKEEKGGTFQITEPVSRSTVHKRISPQNRLRVIKGA